MKKKQFLTCIFLFYIIALYGQFDTKMHVEYSKIVGDSFQIYVSLPYGHNLKDTYKVVYYCDANLKSGKQVRQLISTPQLQNNLKNVIFIGVGHIGNYQVLRRRDFILPTISSNDTLMHHTYYGHAERFYLFLKDELAPAINQQFKTNADSNSIIGHSLGGLFAFFCLFKADSLFSKYFALSPSLWVNNYAIYRFNKINSGFSDKKYLYFASGSKEKVNKILNGTNEIKRYLDKAQYRGLIYEYDIWNSKTHNSEVPLSLAKILKEKL